MKKCRYCGREAAPDFKFCPFCGGELTEEGEADVFLLQSPQPGDEVLYQSWEGISAVADKDPSKIKRKKPDAGPAPDPVVPVPDVPEVEPEPRKPIVPIEEAFPGDNVVVGGVPWKVLWVRGNRKLLLAQQSVAIKAFSESGAASWEGSSLRRWLNKQYIETCFSKEEQAKILPTEYQTRVSEQGKAAVLSSRRKPERTRDRVGILSCKEINFYASELSKEACKTFFSYESPGLVRDVYLDGDGNGSVSVLRRSKSGDEWTAADVRQDSNVYPVIWYSVEIAKPDLRGLR